jgi:hypothetical protein
MRMSNFKKDVKKKMLLQMRSTHKKKEKLECLFERQKKEML